MNQRRDRRALGNRLVDDRDAFGVHWAQAHSPGCFINQLCHTTRTNEPVGTCRLHIYRTAVKHQCFCTSISVHTGPVKIKRLNANWCPPRLGPICGDDETIDHFFFFLLCHRLYSKTNILEARFRLSFSRIFLSWTRSKRSLLSRRGFA